MYVYNFFLKKGINRDKNTEVDDKKGLLGNRGDFWRLVMTPDIVV